MKIIRRKKKNELKPCPFCGGKVQKFKGTFVGTMMFVCRTCGADVCFYGKEYDPDATDAWNRRPENDNCDL